MYGVELNVCSFINKKILHLNKVTIKKLVKIKANIQTELIEKRSIFNQFKHGATTACISVVNFFERPESRNQFCFGFS